jgi:glycosyltransferase A (GT-A) superfamily protein (DUF2064 family)
MEPAARLYRAFLTDLAARFTPVAGVPSAYDLGWAFTPAETDYRALLRDLGHPQPESVRFVPQEGEGWGVRQANLLRWGHDQGYAQTVLVASDSPHLDRAIPGLAFAALEGHDVVFGRVRDGGYYLIGLRGMHEVLSGVPMGTAAAADALVARIAALGLSAAETPPTFDVDEECDLDLLRAELAPDGAGRRRRGQPSETWSGRRHVKGLGLVGTGYVRRRERWHGNSRRPWIA